MADQLKQGCAIVVKWHRRSGFHGIQFNAVVETNETAVRLWKSLGFNVIGTANTRDRGVNEMSAALKRRFNFETVRPISDRAFEAELIGRASARIDPIDSSEGWWRWKDRRTRLPV